jgi:hypothetical protein
MMGFASISIFAECDDNTLAMMGFASISIFAECDDKSDEINCKKVDIDQTYAKDVSPPPYETVKHVEKVAVNVSTTIRLIQGKAFNIEKSC